MIMSDEIVKRVLEPVKAVSQDRHKLVILLGVFGSGKQNSQADRSRVL